jgi:hypothetical protein
VCAWCRASEVVDPVRLEPAAGGQREKAARVQVVVADDAGDYIPHPPLRAERGCLPLLRRQRGEECGQVRGPLLPRQAPDVHTGQARECAASHAALRGNAAIRSRTARRLLAGLLPGARKLAYVAAA